MNISFEELPKYLFGAINREIGYNVYRPLRFTDYQLKTASDSGIFNQYQPLSASSMYLGFHGAVKKLSFDYRILKASSRSFSGFSVHENGKVTKRVSMDTCDYNGHFEYEPKSEGDLQILMPGLTGMAFKNVEVEGEFEPYRPSMRLYVYGDSITQGYDCKEPCHHYINRLMMDLRAEVLNQSIGGDVFRPAMLAEPIPFRPDAAIIALGTNDYAKVRSTMLQSCDEFFSALRARFGEIPVLVLLPVWCGSEEKAKPYEESLDYYRNAIGEIAEKHGMTPLNARDFIPHDTAFYSPDVLHPNDGGFYHYYRGVSAFLQESRLFDLKKEV